MTLPWWAWHFWALLLLWGLSAALTFLGYQSGNPLLAFGSLVPASVGIGGATLIWLEQTQGEGDA